MLEPAANAAHACAEGHSLPWFACIDQCKDFGPYLLVLPVEGGEVSEGVVRAISPSTAPPLGEAPRSGPDSVKVELSSVQSI